MSKPIYPVCIKCQKPMESAEDALEDIIKKREAECPNCHAKYKFDYETVAKVNIAATLFDKAKTARDKVVVNAFDKATMQPRKW